MMVILNMLYLLPPSDIWWKLYYVESKVAHLIETNRMSLIFANIIYK